MRLQECEAKEILKAYGIPVPAGFVIRNPGELIPRLGEFGDRLVLKAQVPVGGRGKAGGIIVTALAPSVEDNKNLPAYLERWKKAYNREPNGLPYTQFFYDSVYIVAALYKYCLNNKIPLTGENMRKALITLKTLELPLTNRVTFKDDRSVESPTYFWQVKDGRFQVIGKQD